jgi:TnpA family transposase
MPVDFLTNDQARRYGRYAGEPTPVQLPRYFYLDDDDREQVAVRRGEHNRLGFALQLTTVRFLGTFLNDPIDVPSGIVTYLARQLEIVDVGCLAEYSQRPTTQWEHADEIQHRYGYTDFSAQPGHFRFVRWLYTRAWLGDERTLVLFDLATAYLVGRKILLPGVTTLSRLVAQVRERAAQRLWSRLAQRPSVEQRQRLENLLVIREGERLSALERLRRAPTRVSAPGLVGALKRLNEFRALGVSQLTVAGLPPGRVKALARYAASAWAQLLERMPAERRLASLLAFAYVYESVAQDDAIDLFQQLVTTSLARAERRGENERLRTLHDLDAAAIALQAAGKIVLDPTCADEQVRARIFAHVPRPQLEQAIQTVDALARSDDDDHYYEYLRGQYPLVRRFLPTLLQAITFQGAQAGQPVLDALQFLKDLEGRSKVSLSAAPRAVIDSAWHRLVIRPNGSLDRRFYTLCVLERLRDGLSRRDIFVSPSERWGDPQAKLLQGKAWEAARPHISRTLGHALTAESELTTLTQQLDQAYRRTLADLPTNAAVQIETRNGKTTLVLGGLDKLEEPASLVSLREQVEALLPRVDLPEVLLEIHGYTRFAEEFTHLSDGKARIENLALSLCAILVAKACNIGLEPLVRPSVPALTRSRLAWVQQNYIRSETLIRANVRLVDAQAGIPLAQQWGGGEVASADGLRFIVPVRTLNAGPNSKYFRVERGVTYYNFTSDQFSGFHGIVIPGTLHDSAYVLDGLLEQQTTLQPRELMTDTAGYSDIVFGLFWLLGYQFSPRLADLGEARFCRIDAKVDYGALNGLARQRINTPLIARHWDDLLRVAGSLQMGTVSASELIRALQRGSKLSALARAIGELGRIAKTLHLLAYVDDETYRRRILTQLNRGEGRHRLARAVFYGQRGELRQRYREGQEDQLGALGLVINMLVLWNTRYMEAALNHLRATGAVVQPEDVARLTPLVSENFHLLGRYQFSLSEALLQGELRPLRDPNSPDELLEGIP